MARAKTAAKATRKRLTNEQKAQIAELLAGGETGQAIAAKMGVSVATVYAQKRKGGPVSAGGESPLRAKLVSFAVRTLLGQSVTADERAELKAQVDAELVRRVAAGL
jgi:transposase-like protein